MLATHGPEAYLPLFSKYRVVVVDDDDAVRDSLRALLESYDVAVDDFKTAVEFLEADDAMVDACLIADVHMPEIDGIELLMRLRAANISAPSVLITGQIDATLIDRALSAGASVVLEKPLGEDELIQALKNAIAN